MPSYLGPGRLAAFSAAAYSATHPHSLPFRYAPFPFARDSATLAQLRIPQDSRAVLRPQRCSLRSPVAKEFTRLPYHSIRHPAISHIKPQPQAPPSKDIPKTQTHQNRIHIHWHLSALSCIIRLRNPTHIIARHLKKGSQQFLAAIPYCRPRSAPAARQSAST